jgi:hypothetical protein
VELALTVEQELLTLIQVAQLLMQAAEVVVVKVVPAELAELVAVATVAITQAMVETEPLIAAAVPAVVETIQVQVELVVLES